MFAYDIHVCICSRIHKILRGDGAVVKVGVSQSIWKSWVSNIPSHPLLSLSFPPLLSSFFLLYPSPPSFPFPGGPTLNQLYIEGLGERCQLASGVWGEAPADKRFGAYLGQKEQLWGQQFFLDFHNNNQFFCTNTRLQILYSGAFYRDNRHYNAEQHAYKILSCCKSFIRLWPEFWKFQLLRHTICTKHFTFGHLQIMLTVFLFHFLLLKKIFPY